MHPDHYGLVLGEKMGLQLIGSLIITLGICFVIPAVSLGVALGVLTLGAWSPFAVISTVGKEHLIDFLFTFGAGNVGQGVIMLCLTLSIVGGLFEVFAFYKYVYLK
ncbi:MAG: hypothetical protein F6K11_14990 [Leptolyngbya sp. SIO3F4]|nr:hypothetical protein [Leptolyngbya sp. SIO3F4]